MATTRMNPFIRITYTDQERERSKAVWKLFETLWDELAKIEPKDLNLDPVRDKLIEALSRWEHLHTEFIKGQSGA